MLWIAPAAVGACSVANTRCPLLAARTAVCAVIDVANFADHDHVGRLPQHASQQLGKIDVELRHGPATGECPRRRTRSGLRWC